MNMRLFINLKKLMRLMRKCTIKKSNSLDNVFALSKIKFYDSPISFSIISNNPILFSFLSLKNYKLSVTWHLVIHVTLSCYKVLKSICPLANAYRTTLVRRISLVKDFFLIYMEFWRFSWGFSWIYYNAPSSYQL